MTPIALFWIGLTLLLFGILTQLIVVTIDPRILDRTPTIDPFDMSYKELLYCSLMAIGLLVISGSAFWGSV